MQYLSESEHDAVSAAVAAAENHTSGEIVTVLAARSDGYTDVALVWAVAVSFTAMALFTLNPDPLLDLFARIAGGWGQVWTRGEVLNIVTSLGLGFFVLMLLVQLWQPLKYALIPNLVERDRVRDAAVRHFKVGAERRTHGRTGILIYLSMAEHRAEIVADEAIAARVDAEVWGVAMADMLAEIRQGKLADGIVAGVRDVGAVLAEHFPRAEDDVNELPDRLIEV